MIEENLGAALRQLRARQHLSLRSLAERTGFSPSFLSQVENAQSSPSLSSIEKITAALGVSLGQFFHTIQVPNTEGVQEHARKEWHLQWLQAQVNAIGQPVDGSSLAAFIVTLDAGGGSGQFPNSPPFDEFAYVLEGDVKLTINTEKRDLHTGDALMIRGGHPRHWQNANGAPARVLIVSDISSRQV